MYIQTCIALLLYKYTKYKPDEYTKYKPDVIRLWVSICICILEF